ncbi:MAG: hypothetical protein V4466_03065, partial [Pseudomonadota bacterium]
MRSALFIGVAFAGLALSAATPSLTADEAFDPLAVSAMCTGESQAAAAAAPADKTPPKMLPGYGNGGFKVDTGNPDAQRWFDQGLRLARAFAHDEAKAAFAEAVRLDPACAMCLWGQAWMDGPTINYGVDAGERTAAGLLAMRAQTMAQAKGTEKEKALTAALVRRYAAKGGDAAYATAMKTLAARRPEDDEIVLLAADAIMIATDRSARPTAAMPLLESILARNPTHTGAIHFYIHASEWVGEPGKAEHYADMLQGLAPGASHLIHMPSHTWYQIGRYRDAARANLEAMKVDEAWIKTTGWTKPGWDLGYYGHNVRFAMGGALMAGDAAAGLKIADHFASQSLAGDRSAWREMGIGSSWYAYGRFAEPDRVLAMPPPAAGHPFLTAMWRYGRGEALARKGDAAGVRAEAIALRFGAVERKAYGRGGKLLQAQADIARLTLLGRAAMIEGRYGEAAKVFRKAAEIQEKTLGDYRDPPPWWYPARRSLAAALLARGQPAPA